MATVYPTATGVYSTRTWNNDADGSAYGMVPQAGDTVLANGTTVTVDQNVTVVELATRAGTTAAAGGGFTTADDGLTITANIAAGTTVGLTFSGASPNVLTVVGNITGGGSNNAYGTTNTSTGTIDFTGNSTGGSVSGTQGLRNSSSGTVNQTGNATGGSGSNAAGTTNTSTGIFVVTGNSTGGSGSGAHGASNSNAAGRMTLTGTATGGTNNTAHGIYGASTPSTGWARVGKSAVGTTGINGHSGFVQFIDPDVASVVEIYDTAFATHALSTATAGGGGLLRHPGMAGGMNG